ncbi:MAG: cobalt ECF transporter T component CbiQ, partial [Deltaproteobacteria bacterium]
VKIITAALFSLVVALTYELTILFVSAVSALAILVAARLPLKKVFWRLIMVNGFILVLWLFLPFTTPGKTLFTLFGLEVSKEGVNYAALITIKSNTIVIACIALLSTCSVFKLVHALHYLYVPDKLVHIFFFSYRYIHVINLEYVRLTNAMKVRCFIPRNNLHTYKSFAYLIGMLILKSYERSRRVYNAMLCRGFKGKFYILEPYEFHASDWLFGIISLLFIAGLVVIQWIPTKLL